MNIQGWFHLGLTGLISLQFKGISRVFSSNTRCKHHFFSAQHSLWPNSHICTRLQEKTIQTFVGKVVSLLFYTLSRFIITFLPRSKCLWNWKSITAVNLCSDFGDQEKVCHCFYFFHFHLPWSEGTDDMILVFWMLSSMPVFSLSSSILTKRLFNSPSLSALEWYHLHIRGCYFSQQSWFQLVIHPVRHFAWYTLHIS